MIDYVKNGDCVLAIVVRAGYSKDGIEFFTPDDYSQQLAFIKHPPGKMIEPHVHNIVDRSVELTQEVLFMRKGRLRIDFFDDDRLYLESRVVGPGDVVLLAAGGHGFEMLEEVEMFEVKQGPYAGDADKVRFVCDPFEPKIGE